MSSATTALEKLSSEVVQCCACHRLVAWREQVAIDKRASFRTEKYWAKPIPGFGDPKAVSWGQLLFFNYESLKVAPWASLAPSAAIFVTVLGFNLLADGLSDAFNPRLKQ